MPADPSWWQYVGGSAILIHPGNGDGTFGTETLSDLAVEAMKDRTACLLANHGMIVIGETLQWVPDQQGGR